MTLTPDFGDLRAAFVTPGETVIRAFARFGVRVRNIRLHTFRPDRGAAELRYVVEFEREVMLDSVTSRYLAYGSLFEAGGPAAIDHRFREYRTDPIMVTMGTDGGDVVTVPVEVIR